VSDDIKRIDIKEFRELGFLQEVNRQFLHPLGLALEVIQEIDGSETLGGVWDYRDDPEGMIFSDDLVDPQKIANVAAERAKHVEARIALLGDVIQPFLVKDGHE
jgi:hypothetical protein